MATAWADRFETLTGIAPSNILRLTMIIGGYLLLRPAVEMFFRKALSSPYEDDQPQHHDAQVARSAGNKMPEGGSDVKGESTGREAGDDEQAQGSLDDWGDALRRRKLERMQEEHDKRVQQQQDEEDLKDIQDFLEDE